MVTHPQRLLASAGAFAAAGRGRATQSFREGRALHGNLNRIIGTLVDVTTPTILASEQRVPWVIPRVRTPGNKVGDKAGGSRRPPGAVPPHRQLRGRRDARGAGAASSRPASPSEMPGRGPEVRPPPRRLSSTTYWCGVCPNDSARFLFPGVWLP